MTKLSFVEDPGVTNILGLDLSKLKINEAYVNVINKASHYENLSLYKAHKDCYHCLFSRAYDLDFTSVFRATYDYKYRVAHDHGDFIKHNEAGNILCNVDYEFGEFGVYNLTINEHGCSLETISEPVSIYFPILTVFLIYVGLILICFAVKHLYEHLNPRSPEDKETTQKKVRIKSLDCFRGIAVVVMIFANFGCGRYDFCDHSRWNGLHIADLVFPWFIWIMGVCIPMSLESSMKRKTPTKTVVYNITKRSIKLFCLGVFISAINFTYLDYIRIFGVLQRLGICYFVVSMIYLFLAKQKSFPEVSHRGLRKYLIDIEKLLYCWVTALIILTIYCLVVFLIADDGCPRGYFGAGGLGQDGEFFNCTGGATGFIDRTILGNHMYQKPTVKIPYQTTQAYDPEGIVGCLPSIFQAFLGAQAGTILLMYKQHSQRLLRWMAWAILTGLIGGGLCEFSLNEGFIPINKNLWSLSFVLSTCSLAFILLSICYILIDVKSYWSGKPFLFAGMNAILVYTGHEMTTYTFPVRWNLHRDNPEHPTHFVALLENLWGTGFWLFIAYYWYSIKYFFVI